MEYPVNDTPSYRYVVLDADGYLLNRILVASPYPDGYYPGYGRYLAYAGDDPAPPEPGNPEVAPDFIYLNVRPSAPMAWGARMDVETGEVTPPPPPPEPTPDEFQEGLA